MTFKQLPDGTYEIEGTRQNWIVSQDLKTCNCPAFRFINKGLSPCKHIIAIRGKEEAPITTDFETWDPSTYVEPLPDYKFIDTYGEAQLDFLIKTFEVIIIRNLVRKL